MAGPTHRRIDVRAARVSDAGALPDPAGSSWPVGPGTQVSPRRRGTAASSWWAGKSPPTSRAARVTTAGTVLDPSGFLVSGTPGSPDHARLPQDRVDVHHRLDRRPNPAAGHRHLRGPGVGHSVSPSGGRLISQGPGAPAVFGRGLQRQRLLRRCGGEARRAGRLDIFGATALARWGDAGSRTASPSPRRGDQTCPAVDWNGSRFFVAWADRRRAAQTSTARWCRPPESSPILGGGPCPPRRATSSSSTSPPTPTPSWWPGRTIAPTSGTSGACALSPTGAVLDAGPLALAVAPNAQVTPDLTASERRVPRGVELIDRAGGFAQSGRPASATPDHPSTHRVGSWPAPS